MLAPHSFDFPGTGISGKPIRDTSGGNTLRKSMLDLHSDDALRTAMNVTQVTVTDVFCGNTLGTGKLAHRSNNALRADISGYIVTSVSGGNTLRTGGNAYESSIPKPLAFDIVVTNISRNRLEPSEE